ncbi:MAG TPA: hypothetical protein VD815_10725 [Candidatus Saccharimonadales bacterium]|nr:hypothetical protein [Candidatus Saccharimonadales bacterium]
MLKEFGISEEQSDWITEEGDAFTDSNSGCSSSITINCSLYNPEEAKSVPEESLLDIINIDQRGSQLDTDKNGIEKSHPRLDVNPVSYFVQVLYKECKTHKIVPAIAVK